MRTISETNIWKEKTRAFILADVELKQALSIFATIACYLRVENKSCNTAIILYNITNPEKIPSEEKKLYNYLNETYNFLSGRIITFLLEQGDFEANFVYIIIDYIINEEIEKLKLLVEHDVADEIEEIESFFRRGQNYFYLMRDDFVCNGQQLIDDFEPESDSFEFYLIDSCTIKYNQIVPTALYFVKLPHNRTTPFIGTIAEHIEYITQNELAQKIRKTILDDWLDDLDIIK